MNRIITSILSAAAVLMTCSVFATVVINPSSQSSSEQTIAISSDYQGMDATITASGTVTGNNQRLTIQLISPNNTVLLTKSIYQSNDTAESVQLVHPLTLQQGTYTIKLTTEPAATTRFDSNAMAIVWNGKGDELEDMQNDLVQQMQELEQRLTTTSLTTPISSSNTFGNYANNVVNNTLYTATEDGIVSAYSSSGSADWGAVRIELNGNTVVRTGESDSWQGQSVVAFVKKGNTYKIATEGNTGLVLGTFMSFPDNYSGLISELQAKALNLDSKIAELEAKQTTAETDKTALETEIASLKINSQDNTARITTLENELAVVQTTLADIPNQISALESALGAAKIDITNLQTQQQINIDAIASNLEKILENRALIDGFQQQIDDLKATFEVTNAAINERIDDLSALLRYSYLSDELLASEKIQAEEAVRAQEQKLILLDTQLKQIESTGGNTSGIIAQIIAETTTYEKLKRKLDLIESAITGRVESEFAVHEKLINDLIAQLEAYKEKNDAAIASINSVVSGLQASNEDILSQIKDANTANEDLQRQINAIQASGTTSSGTGSSYSQGTSSSTVQDIPDDTRDLRTSPTTTLEIY